MLRYLLQKTPIAFALLFFAAISAQKCSAQLYGVHFDTGDLYTVSTTDASLTLVGSTGISSLGSLNYRRSDGFLYGIKYGFTSGPSLLYRIDPATADATLVSSLGPLFEGGLAISPSGDAYTTNGNNNQNASLFSIDLDTGNTTLIGSLGNADVSALTWRFDGKLVGLERINNQILEIDPITASTSVVTDLSTNIGFVGGMAEFNNERYFGTGISGGGSNSLYTYNMFTGVHTLVGNFSPTLSGEGIAGLAGVVLCGDINQDGVVTFLDIPLFIIVLRLNFYNPAADCNFDGVVSFLDIAPFLEALNGG